MNAISNDKRNRYPYVLNNIKYYLKYLGNNKYILRLHNMNEKETLIYKEQFKTIAEYTLTAN